MYFAKIIVKWNFLSDCEKQKLLKRWKKFDKIGEIGENGQKGEKCPNWT